jgi:hypothetical protein
MTLARTLALLAIGLASGPAWSQTARAEEAAHSDEAESEFEKGRALWRDKDPAAALPHFQRAVALTGSPNARFFVARCLRDTGRLAEAYDEMARTVVDARKLAETDDHYAKTRDTAAGELALLEAKVGKLIVALDSTLGAATLAIDGVDMGADKVGKPITVVPGTLRVVAVTAEGERVEQTVTVAAGTTETLVMARPAGAREEVVPPPKAPPPVADEEESDFGVARGIGIGVAAVGIGGFIAFAVGTVQADDHLATLEAECGPGPCSEPRHDDIIDSGRTAEVVAYVGLGVGIAGVVTGTMLILFGGPSDTAQAAWEPTADGFRLRF